MTIIYIMLALCCILLLKNLNTAPQRMRIVRAIGKYHVDLIDQQSLHTSQVEYADMESYTKTLLRIWDWGYTNILPNDKFELIKEYIK